MSRADAILKLDAIGVDDICDDIAEGYSMTYIAREAGVAVSSLLAWIEAVPERSARVREVRASMAKVWDEKAEDAIKQAGEDFDLRKAKELAHHYRWRASKIAPKEYGDRVDHNHAGKLTLESLVAGSYENPNPPKEGEAP